MTEDELPQAMADIARFALQWAREDRTPKTGAALALAAACARWEVLLRRLRDGDKAPEPPSEPTIFVEENTTQPRGTRR